MAIDLSGAIAKELELVSKEARKAIEESAEEASNAVVKMLKETSPKRQSKGGKYAKGWGITKQPILNGTSYVIHNKKHGSLTHLLERGHATRNGGRTRAFVHIEPAEQKAIKEFEEGIRRKIENG